MENISRKVGRPKADKPAKRRTIRVNDDEWAAWQAAGGDNVSQWMRTTLNRAAKRTKGAK